MSSSFDENAQRVLNWILSYQEHIRDYSVTPQTQPGDVLKTLPLSAPETGEAFEDIFDDFEKLIVPAMTHWQHPRFFGYFPANISEPSLLAEFLSSAMGAQCMSWLTSPAATELEERVMEWIQHALDLPSEWSGVIQDTASTATLCALISAREKASGFQSNQKGLYGHTPMTVYCSSEAHSSVEKAVKMAGLGSDFLRKVKVDDTYAMCAESLESMIQSDIKAGLKPLCVVGAFGTTGTTAIDPLNALGDICKKYTLWFHIDAAFAGSAMILPDIRALAAGVEKADSFVFNPHKWLFTHFDCSAYYVKSADTLTQTFGLTPEYLKTDLDKQVNNYRDWGIQLGRRFRALKLWFVLRTYGIAGLQKKIQAHLDYSQKLSELISNHPDFELLCPVPFNTLCFRLVKDMKLEELNELNRSLMTQLNGSGKVFFTHTFFQGKYTLRWVIGQTHVTWDDVAFGWDEVQSQAQTLL